MIPLRSDPSITLRPVTAADFEFLAELYAGTRAEEMKLVDWPDEQKRAFLRSQFTAQCDHYARYYADGSFDVIERGGLPIGRLYVFRGDPHDVRIVDISLVPEARGGGLGTELLLGIMRDAEGSGRSVSIHVERFNPALRLYKRLGFEHVDEHGAYYLMRWRSPSMPQLNTA
jgi:RimJ/RimL family protein N-acetyltransferase